MLGFPIVIGKKYLNEKGEMIYIDNAVLRDTIDFVAGFRFVDQNGDKYTEHGGAVGQFGAAGVSQSGVYSLMSEYVEKLDIPTSDPVAEPSSGFTALRVGQFYRNRIGIPVLIDGYVDPTSKPYAKGYRFTDHRNTHYTETGSVQSKMWKSLDLVQCIDRFDVTPAEIDKIEAQGVKFFESERAKQNRPSALRRMGVFAKNWSAPLVLIGLSVTLPLWAGEKAASR